MPTDLECWETATFNGTTCSWDITGTQPAEPTTECWETATFNNTTCSWDITGTQDPMPTDLECWETATFNNNTCAWVVTNDGDNVDPICNDQDILIELDQFGNATITANQIDNGSTDNCGIESITVNPSSFNSSDIGANIVELAVTDYSGNTSYCNATVTVMQNTLGNTIFNYNEVNIQPNPFNSHIIVNLPVISSNDEFKIKIFDLNGRLVYNKFQSTVNGKLNINGLDNLEQAPYFIKITNLKDGHTIIKKLIKF
ncbi:hypothetical protein D778_00459 [Xanthomarina gelatinilytica]|uniref:Secretion system C-terminal sorting domain-containing protein n=2 Tax=Xanthomarina gelatinilytica TaxID=1137281 RepID=M7MZ98_9FLAO|nr:hypothetical protein D778_00459 [Xanthomarina gelatinilytica]